MYKRQSHLIAHFVLIVIFQQHPGVHGNQISLREVPLGEETVAGDRGRGNINIAEIRY